MGCNRRFPMKFGIHTTDHPPHIASLAPPAALPGGEVELHGNALVPQGFRQPSATIGEQSAPVVMSRTSRVMLHVPPGTISGSVQLRIDGHVSNAMPLSVGIAIADNM